MRWKRGTRSFLNKIPFIGKAIAMLLSGIKNTVKKVFYTSNYFEDLGFYYIGPVNGNDYKTVEKALAEAKRTGKCAIVHTYTKKGKGYDAAERSPDTYHSISSKSGKTGAFYEIFSDELSSLAKKDDKIVAVTAAMGIGTGLLGFEEKYPDRYFDVGIAEAHALTFSAAVAAAGYKPYVAIYSTFLQRGYDNILHDIALQNLPVHIMIDRAGLSLADGATHHGIFDISFLSHIPNISIIAPATYETLRAALNETATASSAVAIRYPNAPECDGILEKFYPDKDFASFGVKADFTEEDAPEYVFITYGNIVKNVIEAQKTLSQKGVRSGIILVEKIKPYENTAERISELIKNAKRVLFVEEGILNGGFSMICSDILKRKHSICASFDIAAIDDNFASPEKICNLHDYVGLSPKKLADAILNL